MSLAGAASAAGADSRVLVAVLDDDINPVSQDYLQDQVRRAETGGYDALVVELDTPGGLGTSMRAIVKAFLASPTAIRLSVTSPEKNTSTCRPLSRLVSPRVSGRDPT